jgi:hypothetical protein
VRRALLSASALALSLFAATTAAADERPSEDQMFGGAPSASSSDAGASDGPPADGGPASALPKALPGAAPPATEAAPPTVATDRDVVLLGDPNAAPRLSQDTAPDDPLKVGGQLYLRALYSRPGATSIDTATGMPTQSLTTSMPSLVDAYFDARPNDRVRGFVLGRMSFDPTLASSSTLPAGGSSVTASAPLLSGAARTRGPTTLLDQLWLRFDIMHTVFVTAGRQHVKWGTARFWTPTDFLHPQARNPIAAFDARPGFTMVKVHVPWEAQGANFYAFALVEGVTQTDARGVPITGSDASGTLQQMGGAARAEFVLGAAELGLDSVVYKGRKPKFGGDLSFGIGDFDLYVDAALRYGSEIPRREYNPEMVPTTDVTTDGMQRAVPFNKWLDDQYPLTYRVGIKPQVSVGGTYSLKYNDNDVFTVTGEYFYNTLGYDDPRVYPSLFLTNAFPFFYVGRHYAAIAAIAAAPYSWNYTTFTLSTLGNLSDQSFITRLDYSLVMLTHLRFEAFGAVNYGRREGEFRLAHDAISLPGYTLPAQSPQSFSLGLGLRIAI